MKKLLKVIVVDTCDDCPYCSHDPHYGMSYDSGYDCQEIGRLVNDCALDRYNKELKEWTKTQNTLFPKVDKPTNPMLIPKNCPLETVNEDSNH
jgi:hypothetical protein